MAAGVVNEARQALPAQPLRGLIAAYDGYRQKGLPPAIHRGLPSPFLTLIFTLDEPLHLVAHPDAQRPPTLYESLLGGLHHTPATIAHAGAQGGIQLCLSPLGARALLGVPAGELASQDFAAGEVLGSLADEISERIAAEPTWEGRFAALDALLVPRLASRPAPPRPVAEAWRLLLGSGGRMSIGRVAQSRPRLPPVRWRASVAMAARRDPKRTSARRPAGSSLGYMNDTAPPPQVWPTLRAHDARALIRFLVDVVGFEETAVYGEGDLVQHAQLSWPPGGGVMLGSARGGEAENASATRPGSFGAYVVADDVDALHARIAAAGADITAAPHNTDYGSRDFSIVDPEGNRWTFGTYRGEPRKGA